jgi:hypothetical protein
MLPKRDYIEASKASARFFAGVAVHIFALIARWRNLTSLGRSIPRNWTTEMKGRSSSPRAPVWNSFAPPGKAHEHVTTQISASRRSDGNIRTPIEAELSPNSGLQPLGERPR